MSETIQITEFGSFVRNREVPGYTTLPAKTFDALENFILSNCSNDSNALQFMGISARKGVGKIITAKNYVGVITVNDGTTIEILPKIYSNKEVKIEEVKKIFLKMLSTLKNTPFKTMQMANVDITKLSILEVFIRMFIDEVLKISKCGLKCDYETIQSNENFFKGKLVFAGQIRHNYAHKERSYIEYDEFNVNRVENRILKSTLKYLYRFTSSNRNKSDIKTLLNIFSEVDESSDCLSDFSRVIPDRKTRDYQNALSWSKVFLSGTSFTSFSGSEVSLALLYPMESLFESYIAALLKKWIDRSKYSVSAQDKTYHLFDEPPKFLIKPDIVISSKEKNDIDKVLVMDTKWKILSDEENNYGISQADMYQMYVYQKKYKATNVTLIYPYSEKIKNNTDNIQFNSNDGVKVLVRFINLLNAEEQIEELLISVCQC